MEEELDHEKINEVCVLTLSSRPYGRGYIMPTPPQEHRPPFGFMSYPHLVRNYQTIWLYICMPPLIN